MFHHGLLLGLPRVLVDTVVFWVRWTRLNPEAHPAERSSPGLLFLTCTDLTPHCPLGGAADPFPAASRGAIIPRLLHASRSGCLGTSLPEWSLSSPCQSLTPQIWAAAPSASTFSQPPPHPQPPRKMPQIAATCQSPGMAPDVLVCASRA